MLGATHGSDQVAAGVDTDVETSCDPFGEVACPIRGRHLGLVEQLEGGDLKSAMPGDLPFLIDQDLFQDVDGEVGLPEVEGGGAGLRR